MEQGERLLAARPQFLEPEPAPHSPSGSEERRERRAEWKARRECHVQQRADQVLRQTERQERKDMFSQLQDTPERKQCRLSDSSRAYSSTDSRANSPEYDPCSLPYTPEPVSPARMNVRRLPAMGAPAPVSRSAAAPDPRMELEVLVDEIEEL